MQRLNKEVLNCDLDRVSTSIAHAQPGFIPTCLKIVKDKYVNLLRKRQYSRKIIEIDETALEIVSKDGVLLNNLQPIRYVFYVTVFII